VYYSSLTTLEFIEKSQKKVRKAAEGSGDLGGMGSRKWVEN
jgi:hypothetical protein